MVKKINIITLEGAVYTHHNVSDVKTDKGFYVVRYPEAGKVVTAKYPIANIQKVEETE